VGCGFGKKNFEGWVLIQGKLIPPFCGRATVTGMLSKAVALEFVG
jgi:hypothetical protein